LTADKKFYYNFNKLVKGILLEILPKWAS